MQIVYQCLIIIKQIKIPNKTIPIKNKHIQKLDNGNIANALGKILKHNYGPDNVKSFIYIPNSFVKYPKYMNIFNAHNIPHPNIPIGII